jgi:hypothetical protein
MFYGRAEILEQKYRKKNDLSTKVLLEYNHLLANDKELKQFYTYPLTDSL